MKSILIISDTHINQISDLPDVIWERAAASDLVIHAGDVTRYEVIQDLKAVTRVEAVCGNMDLHHHKLPSRRTVNVSGFKFGITHSAGSAHFAMLKARKSFEDMDVIVFGHTHFPLIERLDGVVMFNPGSPTDPRSAPFASFGWVEIEDEAMTLNLFTIDEELVESLIVSH